MINELGINIDNIIDKKKLIDVNISTKSIDISTKGNAWFGH